MVLASLALITYEYLIALVVIVCWDNELKELKGRVLFAAYEA